MKSKKNKEVYLIVKISRDNIMLREEGADGYWEIPVSLEQAQAVKVGQRVNIHLEILEE